MRRLSHSHTRTHTPRFAGDASTDANDYKKLDLPHGAAPKGIQGFIAYCMTAPDIKLTYECVGGSLVVTTSVSGMSAKIPFILEAARQHISSSITAANFTGASLRGAFPPRAPPLAPHARAPAASASPSPTHTPRTLSRASPSGTISWRCRSVL